MTGLTDLPERRDVWLRVRGSPSCSGSFSLSTSLHRILMMKMKSGLPELFLLLFSCRMSALGSVLIREYKYFPCPYAWQDARSRCSSEGYTDLATIYASSDTDQMQMDRYFAWIGLYYNRDTRYWYNGNWYYGYWYWVGAAYNTFSAWESGEPQSNDIYAVVESSVKKFHGVQGGSYFFICQELINGIFEYTFIPEVKTRSEALDYCKKHFDDLAVLSDESKLNASVIQRDFPVWTGLRRDGQTWSWRIGSSGYRKWALNEPDNKEDCVTISSISREMSTQSCTARFPFVCYKDNVVLVKQEKTWEEALEHCQAHSYQLLSLQPGDDHRKVMTYVLEADTEKVWTGLRFLAGQWMWLNKADMNHTDLPPCPHEVQHCGALSKSDTSSLEPTDCLMRLNFLCYNPS